MKKVRNSLAGKTEIIELLPAVVSSMKFGALATVKVEISLSIEKAVFKDRRGKRTAENVELVVVSHHFLNK